MKTLIVDDETISCKVLKKIMAPLGETHVARNGEGAVDSFKQGWADGLPFDLIFLDIGLEEGSGVDTLKTIRDIEERKLIPKNKRSKIIMVTSQSAKDTVISCIQAGCDDYIIKPAKKSHIYDKLKQVGFSV